MIPLNRKFLLADDDYDDATLFCEALTQIAPVMECNTVENGKALFELLSKNQDLKPDIIFLDINMPIMNGWECLKNLKSHQVYKDIPAVIYSTSSSRRDIDMAYSLGALLFLTKPDDFQELCKILEVVSTTSKDLLPNKLSMFQSVKLN